MVEELYRIESAPLETENLVGRVVQAQLCAGNFWQNTAPVVRDLLVNGNFDLGFDANGLPIGWRETSLLGFAIVGAEVTLARSPLFFAWLGFDNNNTETLTQTVVVPPNTIGLVGTYAVQIDTTDSAFTAYDTLSLRIGDTVFLEDTNLDASPLYTVWDAIPISNHAGETIDFEFTAITDVSLPTDFRLDDLELNATLCE